MTDAPKHNLALMKISTYHKERGDSVFLGSPQDNCDLSYASWLFKPLYHADVMGGPGYDPTICLNEQQDCKPDYSLYPQLDYSLGYTWSHCPRHCEFCVVGKQKHDMIHHSILEFHDDRFSKICLLNNNTFTDPRWRDTFDEIWERDLTVIDENGYDMRLLDDEKVEYLNKTKFQGDIHFAWDRIKDYKQIIPKIKYLKQIKHQIKVYVLVGYENPDITKWDIARCAILRHNGIDPFVMVYNRVRKSKSPKMRRLNQFERMVNRTYIWWSMGFRKAWREYCVK